MTMMPLGEAFYRGRVQAVQGALNGAGGILLLDAHDVVYTTGFVHSPSERPIGVYIPPSGAPTLFIPLLEQENAEATWVSDIRIYFEYPGETDPITWMHAQIDSDRLADPAIVKALRWVKTEEELACVRQAARYADLCLETIRDAAPGIIRAGGTEIDILEAGLKVTRDAMFADLGGTYARRLLNVVGTVHSGPRAALPHGETSTRTPQPGDTLIAGIGASVGGYHAESGATFLVGEATGDRLRVLEACAACDAAAREALTVGASCDSVNTAALDALKNAGLEDAIRHRIGHGMGLQSHEAPWLAPGDRTPVAPGMVFSSEPGVYRPGTDGYRTINTFIVTESGVDVPSRFLAENPPEARILPI